MLVFIIIIVTLVGIGVSHYFRLQTKNHKWTAWITLFVTIFGIFLAVSDDFFRQYDYCWNDFRSAFWKNVFSRENVICMRDLKGYEDDNNNNSIPKVFFVMDRTGSMNSVIEGLSPLERYLLSRHRNELNRKMVTEINSNVRQAPNIPSSGNVRFGELVRNQMLQSLFDLREDGVELLTIIGFYETPDFMLPINRNPQNIDHFTDVFEIIAHENFGQTSSNFKTLATFIQDRLIDDENAPFDRNQNVLLFFSDFIHEPRDRTPINMNRNAIASIFRDVGFLDFFFNVVLFDHADYRRRLSISDPNINITLIQDIMEEVLPSDRLRITTIRGAQDEGLRIIWSSLITLKPLRFYYRRGLHEDNIAVSLCFNNLLAETTTQEFRFRLSENSNRRQQFQISSAGRGNFNLRERPITKPLDRENTVTVTFRGHISQQQFSPSLYIESDFTRSIYRADIVFFQKPSMASKILGVFLLSMLLGILPFIVKKIIEKWKEFKKEANKPA